MRMVLASTIKLKMQQWIFTIIVAKNRCSRRESNPQLPLRRAPTNCHSLSIWGKVNPYGTLLETVSDSIWVILNTPSVKLCKALKVSWLFAPANNRGMPWYYPSTSVIWPPCFVRSIMVNSIQLNFPIVSTRYFLVYN